MANGLNAVGGTAGGVGGAAGPTQADGAGFDAILETGIANIGVAFFQFIGADVIESILDDETSIPD